MKNKILGFIVGFVCALLAMVVLYFMETYMLNKALPEFFRGVVFASVLLAGRNVTIEFLQENHL